MNILELNKLLEEERKSGRRVIFLDASGLKDTGCFRKFFWSCIKGYKPKDEALSTGYDLKIEYGTAFHRFLEHWYKGVKLDEAVQKAAVYYDKILSATSVNDEYEFRTMTHLLQSIKQYAEYYPKENDGLRAEYTEQKFAFPYWRNDKYTIMLCGTIDLVGTYHGIPCVADHKTTASYITKSYFEQYELGIQTMFYVWIHKYLYKTTNFKAAVINGIFVKKPTETARKKNLFDGVKFERSKPFEYSQEQMDGFFVPWLTRKIETITARLSNCLEPFVVDLFTNDYDLTFCKTPFGMCKYWNICKAPVSVQQMILSNGYVETQYSPLSFGGGGE